MLAPLSLFINARQRPEREVEAAQSAVETDENAKELRGSTVKCISWMFTQ